MYDARMIGEINKEAMHEFALQSKKQVIPDK